MFLSYSLAGIPVWTNTSSKLDTREEGIASAMKDEGPRRKVESFKAHSVCSRSFPTRLEGMEAELEETPLSVKREVTTNKLTYPRLPSQLPRHPSQLLCGSMDMVALVSLTPARFPVSTSGEHYRARRGAHLQAEHAPEPTVHKGLRSPAPGVAEFHSVSFWKRLVKYIFSYMYVGVEHACECGCWNPENGAESPRVGVTGGCEALDVGMGTSS